MEKNRTIASSVLLCLLLGCQPSDGTNQAAPASAVTSEQAPANTIQTEPKLANFLAVSGQVYVGGEPHGEVDFQQLADFGVTTIVSVDGAVPDVETAKSLGMRYIHIPIGYDGISTEQGLAFANVAKSVDGPVYVHCHHGQHRGPAAAAVVCLARNDFDKEMAIAILEQAGTSRDYAGLWRDVERFDPPKAGIELPALVEKAQIESMVGAMARIDRVYDSLKLCQAAGWAVPKEHPDLEPVQLAKLLSEGFRESARHLNADENPKLQAQLKEAEEQSEKLWSALKESDRQQLDGTFQLIRENCKACHRVFRN